MRSSGYAFHVQTHFIVGTIPTIFFFSSFSAGSAEGLWHPTPDLLSLRSTRRPALRSLLFSSFRTGGEREPLPYDSVALVGLHFVAPGVSPLGETRAGDRTSGRFTE